LAPNTISIDDLRAIPTAAERVRDVDVPGIGHLRIRPLSLAEASDMRRDCWHDDVFDDARWQTLLISTCVVEPVISHDDAARLRQLPSRTVDALISEISMLAAITDKGTVSAKAVAEAEAEFRQEPDEGV